MRLFNRGAQRYLLRRSGSGPSVGVPGSNVTGESDWRLIQVGGLTAILPSSAPGVYLCPQAGSVTVEPAPQPEDAAWWVVQPAEGDSRFIVDAGNREMALAAKITDGDDLRVVTQVARDRSAMWLIQPDCVADARSVHLRYETPNGMSVFYNELTVEQIPPGTFFCIAGFGANAQAASPSGYAGIQHRPDGSRIAIFSVWHRMADQVQTVPAARAVVLGAAPQAETTLFGGEGSGASVRLPYEWADDTDDPVRFVLTAERLGSDTAIAAYIGQGPASWFNLGVILRTETGGALLSHPYAFIEDFLRNGNNSGVAAADRSPYRVRSGIFRNPWFAVAQQPAMPVSRAHLTAFSPHPLENVTAAPFSLRDFGLRVATGTRSAAEPPPIGAHFTDTALARRVAPDFASVPHS